MIGAILEHLDGITFGIHVGIEMGSLDLSFGVSNHGKLEIFLLRGSLVSTDGRVIGSDEVITNGSTNGNVLGTILIHLDGLDVGTELGLLEIL